MRHFIMIAALTVGCGAELPETEQDDSQKQEQAAPEYNDSITINNYVGDAQPSDDADEAVDADDMQGDCVYKGMSKEDVREVLGDPESLTSRGHYRYTDDDVCVEAQTACLVKFKNGAVNNQKLINPDKLCLGGW